MDGKQIGGGESTLAYDSWGIEPIIARKAREA